MNLLQAAKIGNLAEVQRLLAEGTCSAPHLSSNH